MTAVAVKMSNLEAEQALVGCVLYENSTLSIIGDYLRGHHFGDAMLGWLFDQARDIIAKDQRADAITVGATAAGYEGFHNAGGVRYLADLVDHAPPPMMAADYARVVFDCALRRDLFHICETGTSEIIRERARPAFDIATDLRHALDEIEAASAPEDRSMVDAPAAAADALANMREMASKGAVRGKMTGLRCIDRRLGGLRPGALVVIGARPSMGKTALARAIAHGAAVRSPDQTFLFLGIEMGPEEMSQRELSALTYADGDGVEYQAMAKGSVTEFELMAVERAQAHVPPNLIFDDCHTLTVEDVRRKIWSLKRRRRRVAAVFIDYLQLMRRPNAQGRNEASVLAEMTMTLKQIARLTGVCVVLLSQLSRAVESRDDKRPQLTDLRESGSIEQDADAVLFPYREYYYVSRSEPTKPGGREEWDMRCAELRTRLDVICAKQRQGPIGTDRQVYRAEYDHIEDEGAY